MFLCVLGLSEHVSLNSFVIYLFLTIGTAMCQPLLPGNIALLYDCIMQWFSFPPYGVVLVSKSCT